MKARQSGTWSQIKLSILNDYINAFAKATKSAGSRYYIDAFAGPGVNQLRQTTRIFDGSPKLALKVDPPFTKCFFIEKDEENIRSLEKIISQFPERSDSVVILNGDCNQKIAEVLEQIPAWAPTFAFLDPEGTELSWNTLERIADHKKRSKTKIEIMMLFQYDTGFVRLLCHDEEKFYSQGYEKLITSMYGDKSWLSLYKDKIAGKLSPNLARKEFMLLFVKKIKEDLGYKIVLERLITDNTRPKYYLIFASDHDVGDRIIRHVFGKNRDDQQQLFKLPYKPLSDEL